MIKLSDSELTILDRVQNYSGLHTVRYHLHPKIKLSFESNRNEGILINEDGKEIYWHADADEVFIEKYKYATKFGLLTKGNVIILNSRNKNTALNLNWIN